MSTKAIFENRIVPVVSLKEAEVAVPLAEALLAGGLDILEITFRTPAAEPALRSIAKALPKMRLGAGTLLNPQQLVQAQDAGAQFGVAPGLNPRTVEAAQKIGFTFIPGAVTPTEVEIGLSLGCQLLKFFPANLCGGIPMLKELSAPYGHTGLKFMVTGGMTPQNMREYLDVPIVAAIGGSWVVDAKLIAAKDWAAITSRARETLALIRQ